MRKLTLLFATALMALAPLGASARVRARGFIGPPAVTGAFLGSQYYGPGPHFYVPYDNTGEVKIDTNKHIKEAAVYVDGAYADLVKDNKTTHFRQGGQTLFSDRVYVTSGKTIHINPAS